MKISVLLICTFFFLITPAVSGQNENWAPVWDSAAYGGVTELYADSNTDQLFIACNNKMIVKNGISMQINGLARFNGTKFFKIGNGLDDYQCFNVCNNPFQHIIKFGQNLLFGGGGSSINNAPVPGVLAWTGSSWLNVGGTGLSLESSTGIMACSVPWGENLLVGGFFDKAGFIPTYGLAILTPFYTWSAFPVQIPVVEESGIPIISCMIWYKGALYVGGNFWADIDGHVEYGILKYEDGVWKSVYGGTYGAFPFVYCMEIFQGKLYVGGYFRKQDGNTGNKIMRLGDDGWEEVGGGIAGIYAYVTEMRVWHDALYVIGNFQAVGNNLPANSIARWDGQQWCSLGGDFGTVGIPRMEIYHDTLYVGGTFTMDGPRIINFAKWIGGDYVAGCDGPVGTEEETRADIFTVSPNPANDRVHIRFPSTHPPADIRVFDLAGREKARLASDVLAGRTGAEISLAGWPPGIYLVRADFGERQVVRKLAVF